MIINSRMSQRGFTLIELAIVLVIVGVLIGSFIGTLTTRIENMRVSETKQELELIKSALIGYAYTNGYLPCPDCISPLCGGGSFRDGTADRTGNACAVGDTPGSIPWVDLGLGNNDAWNTRYRYWVDSTFASDAVPFFTLADVSTGVINHRDSADAIETLATNVAAVVFSHGKNTFGGISANNVTNPAIPVANIDELENTNANKIFVSRPPTTAGAATAGGEFDDIVEWISEYELKAKMVEAGRLP